MKGSSRRSLLQAEILLQLEEQPAKTITEIANRVDAQRPSVSRSLHTLKEQGLVQRDRTGWQLTEDGKAEAAEARATLVGVTEKVKAAIERTSEVWRRTGVLDHIPESMRASSALAYIQAQFLPSETYAKLAERLLPSDTLASAAEQARASSALTNFRTDLLAKDTIAGFGTTVIPDIMVNIGGFVPPDTMSRFGAAVIPDIMATVGDFAPPDLFAKFGDAIKPLIDAQERNSSLLNNILGSTRFTGLEEITRQNNLVLAKAIDDVVSIRQAGLLEQVAEMSRAVDLPWVSAQLSSVNQAYQQLFRHELEHLDLSHLAVPSYSVVERIAVPTTTVGYYNDSLHDLVIAEVESDDRALPSHRREEMGDTYLDPLLEKLDHNFVEMRRGSWSVLRAGGPDRLRHAAASQRELLSQILQKLVPTEQLPQDNRQGPQIKARVRIALEGSKSNIKFASTLAEAVLEAYSQLNKYTHHNEKHEDSLRALLHTGEGLIRFILVNTIITD